MNCDYYREQLLADPLHRSPELQQHLQQCAECRQYSVQVDAFEAELRRSIQMPVEQISFPDISSTPTRPRHWITMGAVAAMLLLTIALVIKPDTSQHEALAVTSDILHHLADEPQAFASTEIVDPGKLLAVMGAKLEVTNGWYATYANPCKIRGIPGLHIVYRKGKEAATLILLPGELPVDESHVAARYTHGMTVVVIPSSPTKPDQLLAGLDPVLYPL